MSTAELNRPARRRSDALANDGRTSIPTGVPRAREPRLAPPDADGVPFLFPTVRPGGGTAVSARRRVPQFDERASAATWILAKGLRRLDPDRRRHILGGWCAPRRPTPASVIVDGGCDVRIRGSAVTGAVRSSLLEWLPLVRLDLEVYDGGLFEDEPASAVTLLLRPPTIWTVDEAVRAGRLYGRTRAFEPERFDALECYARTRVTATHVDRLREASAKIRLQLPVAELPRASSIVAAGCAVIDADDGACAAIAACQLARLATSAFVLSYLGRCPSADRAKGRAGVLQSVAS
jgi:hypothetical protein